MLNCFRRLLAFTALMTATVGFAQEQMVSMYLEPDISGTIYFQERMSVLDQLEPRPLLDGSGAGQGWMFVQYPGTYVGYVPSSEMNPGNVVRNGAKAHLRPDMSSPVLAVILDGDDAKVSRVENGWATVTFVGEAPAYFRPREEGSASATITAPVAAAPAPAAPTPASTGPVKLTGAPNPAFKASPNPTSAPTSGGAPVLPGVVMQESPTLTPAPTKIQPPAQSVARYVQGRLEPVSVWDRTFGSKYKYRLINANDDTIAYVVLDESLLFGTAESYWGKQVEIQGVMKKLIGTIPLEITASNVRVLR